MRYILGLDVGIASVGWAVLDPDAERIVDLGVRAFQAAESPKNGAPLAEPRRLARSARRRLRRRAGRLRRIKELFVRRGLIPQSEIEMAFQVQDGKPDPWQLRAEGLDRLLTPQELARALFHIAKYRGFKSNRKNIKVAKDGEEGKMLASVQANTQMLREKGYRTAGEMLYKDEQFQECKRNKAGSYKNTLDRAILEDEINTLFECQRKLGSQFATTELQEEYLELFRWQMPFASGDDILRKVGKCTFEPDEYRAPKSMPTVERFVLFQKLNQLTYYQNGDRQQLTAHQREAVLKEAYKRGEIKYAHIRKILNLSDDVRFCGLQYVQKKKGVTTESLECENRALCPMHGYRALKKALSEAGTWDKYSEDFETLDHLAAALTLYKTDEDLRKYLDEKGIEPALVEAIASIPSFTGFSHLSRKAILKILPHLEDGYKYHEACAKAGYNHSRPVQLDKSEKLPPINADEIRNPVVLRALTQARKVINAVIARYGSPYRVHIELARDIGKTYEERSKIAREQEENRKAREEEKQHLRELKGDPSFEPSGEDILKYRLYREQNGQCAYSQKPLEISRLLREPGYAEIDHILPYSRSFDDAYTNKVLVLGSENRQKQNRTPFEYFGSDEQRWSKFESWVHANIRNYEKREKLLRKDFDQEAEEKFIKRNLNDTRWIGRYLKNFIANTLIFADPAEKVPVVCMNGQVVALARGLWGLSKQREEDDLHHAVDAACVAALTQGLVKRITEYRKLREIGRLHPGEDSVVDTRTDEVIEFVGARNFAFPQPWKLFRKELIARLSSDPVSEMEKLGLQAPEGTDLRRVIVSRAPYRKALRQLHEETIRSRKHIADTGQSTVRKPLTELTEKGLDCLLARETDPRLYSAIRERMEQYGNDAKKAFAEPLYKPTKDGKPGPLVRRVKICQTQNSGVYVRGGIADNSSMIRIDISTRHEKGKTKWRATPIYSKDVAAGNIPDVPGDFMFSLYPYDLVRIVANGKEHFGYYRGYDVNRNSIEICDPNNAKTRDRVPFSQATIFEKYTVGLLGDYHLVKREKRVGVAGNCNTESSQT